MKPRRPRKYGKYNDLPEWEAITREDVRRVSIDEYARRRPISISWVQELGSTRVALNVAGALWVREHVPGHRPIGVRVLRGKGANEGEFALQFVEYDHRDNTQTRGADLNGGRDITFNGGALSLLASSGTVTLEPRSNGYLVGIIPRYNPYEHVTEAGGDGRADGVEQIEDSSDENPDVIVGAPEDVLVAPLTTEPANPSVTMVMVDGKPLAARAVATDGTASALGNE